MSTVTHGIAQKLMTLLLAGTVVACGSGGASGGGSNPSAICLGDTCSATLQVSQLSIADGVLFFRDLDGDGAADAVARAAHTSELVLYSGPQFTELARQPGDDVPSIANAGDVTGDGIDDFLLFAQSVILAGVKAVEHQTGGGKSFRFIPESVTIENGTSADAPIVVIGGISGFGRTGAVELARDLNGDGAADLVAASRQSDADRVRIWSGADGTALLDIDAVSENTVDQYFGMSVGAVGDANGDGFDDFAVGAPDYAGSGNSSDPAGRVYVYSGGDGVSAQLGSLLYAVEGRESDELGWSAPERLGDVDGDGRADFAIAAPNAREHLEMTLAGRVFVVSGSDGHVLWERKQLPLPPQEQFCPESFASRVVAAGDVDGDGVPDLASLSQDFCRRDLSTQKVLYDHASKLYVLSGDDGSVIFSIVGQYGHELFAADVDGDGANDVVVAHDQESSGGPHAYTVLWGTP